MFYSGPYISSLRPKKTTLNLKAIAAKTRRPSHSSTIATASSSSGSSCILNNREEAEDVLRKCFCKSGAKRRFRRKSRSPVHVARDFGTQSRHRSTRTLAARDRVAEAGAREAVELVSDAATDALKSEQRGLVTKALAQLPDEQKRPPCSPISTDLPNLKSRRVWGAAGHREDAHAHGSDEPARAGGQGESFGF